MSTPQYPHSRPNNQWQTNEVTVPFVHDNPRTYIVYILLLNFVFPHPGERSQRRAVHSFLILVVILEQDDLLALIAAVQSLDIQSTGEAVNDDYPVATPQVVLLHGSLSRNLMSAFLVLISIFVLVAFMDACDFMFDLFVFDLFADIILHCSLFIFNLLIELLLSMYLLFSFFTYCITALFLYVTCLAHF